MITYCIDRFVLQTKYYTTYRNVGCEVGVGLKLDTYSVVQTNNIQQVVYRFSYKQISQPIPLP